MKEKGKQVYTIKIHLDQEDGKGLAKAAGRVGLTVSELLENFIADLICGKESNGSDERMYAQQWFDRCAFSRMGKDTLLRYLLDMEVPIDRFLYVYWQHREATEESKEWQRELEEEYLGYVEDFITEHTGRLDMEEEVDAVRRWYHESYMLLESKGKTEGREEKQARWHRVDLGRGMQMYYCSECGFTLPISPSSLPTRCESCHSIME